MRRQYQQLEHYSTLEFKKAPKTLHQNLTTFGLNNQVGPKRTVLKLIFCIGVTSNRSYTMALIQVLSIATNATSPRCVSWWKSFQKSQCITSKCVSWASLWTPAWITCSPSRRVATSSFQISIKSMIKMAASSFAVWIWAQVADLKLWYMIFLGTFFL